MTIFDFNPWWKSLKVPEFFIGKHRNIFDKIITYLDYRQIILLFGLRRAGKTTIMYQIIDYLLQKKKIQTFNILYFSFDEQKMDLDEILEVYQTSALKEAIDSDNKIFLFVDEIQKLNDWANKIKLIYDRYPNIKIFISGSSNLSLQSNSKESLAGRFFEFLIEPMHFDEFVRFKGISIDEAREDLYEKELKVTFLSYLKTGGFIETIDFDKITLKKYMKESILERVIYKDIPDTFQINTPELLLKLLYVIASNPGMYLDYKLLGNDLKVDQRTISNYISYLCHSLLIKKMYNFSKNRLTSEKKIKRIYFNNTGFIYALNADSFPLDLVIENYFAYLFKSHFFYRSPQKNEVDIIIDKDENILPVEIKIRNQLRPKDYKNLNMFMKKFHVNNAVLISKNHESIKEFDGLKIFTLPYWKYWSIQKRIKNM